MQVGHSPADLLQHLFDPRRFHRDLCIMQHLLDRVDESDLSVCIWLPCLAEELCDDGDVRRLRAVSARNLPEKA